MSARKTGAGHKLLTYCSRLYEFIEEEAPSERPAWLNDFPNLLSVLQPPGRTLVIRIPHVAPADPVHEAGDDDVSLLATLLDHLSEVEEEGKQREELSRLVR
jgi:hypothetical protein